MGNTNFEKLIDVSDKLNYWIFGHTHKQYNLKYKGVHFISNPRGRPEDENREVYNIKKIHF